MKTITAILLLTVSVSANAVNLTCYGFLDPNYPPTYDVTGLRTLDRTPDFFVEIRKEGATLTTSAGETAHYMLDKTRSRYSMEKPDGTSWETPGNYVVWINRLTGEWGEWSDGIGRCEITKRPVAQF